MRLVVQSVYVGFAQVSGTMGTWLFPYIQTRSPSLITTLPLEGLDQIDLPLTESFH